MRSSGGMKQMPEWPGVNRFNADTFSTEVSTGPKSRRKDRNLQKGHNSLRFTVDDLK